MKPFSREHARPLRVFLGFHDVALYQSQLKKGLAALGCRVTQVVCGADDLGFGKGDTDRAVPFKQLERAREWNQRCWQRLDRIPKTALLKLVVAVWILRVSAAWKKAWQWAALLWTIARHDVIVLSHGESFLESSHHVMEPTERKFTDLKLIKRAGRTLIYTFHGADSRPPYLDGYVMKNARRLTPDQWVALTQSRYRLVRGIEQYADYLVSVPAQTCFHSRPVVLHEYLGRPFEMPEERRGSETEASCEAPIVLHAPSNPHAKGTDHVRAIMARLQEKGLRFEYVELVRRPHAELVRELQRATVVVDQMYSDRFITGLATEAMFFRKPVLLAGYYAKYYRQDYEGRVALPPAIFCMPEELEAELESLLNDHDRCRRLGEEGYMYVCEQFAPVAVARRWIEMIEGRLPPQAYYDPYDLRYPCGVGLSKDELTEIIRAMLRQGGRKVLCLSDKPELEAAVLALAE